MKIAYIVGTFPKLSESFVLNEIITLIDKGHDIRIYSLKAPEEEVEHDEIFDYNLKERTKYITSRKGKLEKGIKAFRTPSKLNYSSRSWENKLLASAGLSEFKENFKSKDFDVIHAHFNGATALTAMMLSDEFGIPFTFTGHAKDIFVDPRIESFKKKIENAEKFITPSYYNKDYIQDLTGISKERIEVVRACSMSKKFKKIKRSPESVQILSVARLVEKKGLKYGIKAVGKLKDEYPELKYKIVGSGDKKDDLKDIARRNNIEESITFLDNVNDEILLNEIKSATLFILPAVIAENGDRDVCPLALQEAMIAETPVISTNIASIPELIEDGKSGILVEPRNSRELANEISELLGNDELRKKLGRKGKKKVESEFNINQEVDKLLSVWENLN